jgi:hypothetical protein
MVYVDESGDEGFVRGASEWFVISGVIIRRAIDLETVKVVDTVRTALNKPAGKPLHFRHLNHMQRVAYVAALAGQRMRTVSVMVHKPSITNVATMKKKNVLYFYASRYLLERVSWYCRDILQPNEAGDGSAEIIFSNKGGMSYEDFRTYVDRLRNRSDVRIDWNVIKRDQISSKGHAERRGLQIADAVASGYWNAVNRNALGLTEDRYARTLEPIAYAYKGRRIRSYGVKFVPDVTAMLKTQPAWAWAAGIK